MRRDTKPLRGLIVHCRGFVIDMSSIKKLFLRHLRKLPTTFTYASVYRSNIILADVLLHIQPRFWHAPSGHIDKPRSGISIHCSRKSTLRLYDFFYHYHSLFRGYFHGHFCKHFPIVFSMYSRTCYSRQWHI